MWPNGWQCQSVCLVSQLVSRATIFVQTEKSQTTVGMIAMKFGSDIYVNHWMNPNDYGEPMTPPPTHSLTPP